MVYNILLNAFSAMKKYGKENSRMPYFNGILLDTEFKLKKKWLQGLFHMTQPFLHPSLSHFCTTSQDYLLLLSYT